MISVVRKLDFCAGHRVVGHEGKCKNLHGHQYQIEVHATAPDLDSLGRVIDFSVLKDRVGSFIDKEWDHGFLLWNKDSEALQAMAIITGQKIFLLPYNPTAENIARFLLQSCRSLLNSSGVSVYKIVCHETPNCRAEVTA